MDNKNEFTKYHQHFVNTYEINEAQKTITEEKFVNKEDGDNYELDDLPYQACIRTYKDQELSILESEKYYVQKAIIEEEEADGTRAGIAAAKALTVTDNKIITKNDQRNNPLISYLLASKTGDDPKKVSMNCTKASTICMFMSMQMELKVRRLPSLLKKKPLKKCI